MWHCTAAFTGNARALWQLVIKFPTPVSWRLTFSLLTGCSLLCLPCAVSFIFPSHKGQPSISECCFCSIPVHVLLLSVVQGCNRICHSQFLKLKLCSCTLLAPPGLPLSTPCAWGSRGVIFMLFPQDSWGIALSDWDDQAKAKLPGVAQVWRPGVPRPELKSMYWQQRHHGSNDTGRMCCQSLWCRLERRLWGCFKVIS